MSIISIYNSPSRYITSRLEICNTRTGNIITWSADDALVDWALTECCYDDQTQLFDSQTYHQLSIRISDLWGAYLADGSYPLEEGDVITVYITAEHSGGLETCLGQFEIDDVTGSRAEGITSVIAYCPLYKLLKKNAVNIDHDESTMQNIYAKLFYALGCTSADINEIDNLNAKCARFAPMSGELTDTLICLNQANMATTYSTRTGGINIKHLVGSRNVVDTIDANVQLYGIADLGSIKGRNKNYHVLYNHVAKGSPQLLIEVGGISIAQGTSTHTPITWDTAIAGISHVQVINEVSETKAIIIESCDWNSKGLQLKTSNTNDKAVNVTLRVYGQPLEGNYEGIRYLEEEENIVEVRNPYIQDATMAQRLEDVLNLQKGQDMFIKLSTRGNPGWQLLDMLRVFDDTTDTTYQGYLISQTFFYDGGLESDVVLLNSRVLGGRT